MQVSEVMTTGLITAKADETVRSVIGKMVMRRCGAIPIIDDDDKLVGVVTIRDVLLPLYPNYGDYVHDNIRARDFEQMEKGYATFLETKVGELMTPDPMTVAPSDPVLKAASYMGLRNLRRIPVTDEGRLVGVVSIGDINRGLFLHHLHHI